MITSGHNKDRRKIQRLHTDLGDGKNIDIFLWIMAALVMLAITRAPASSWHQRGAKLSVIAKKICVSALHGSHSCCVLQLVFSCIFSSDLRWSVVAGECQDVEEIC